MKAITIHQPWATLISERIKVFETRSWPIPESVIKACGWRIAIHAAKTKKSLWLGPNGTATRLDGKLWPAFYAEKNIPWGYPATLPRWTQFDELLRILPRGAIIATCTISQCFKVNHRDPVGCQSRGNVWFNLYDVVSDRIKFMEISELEDSLGDFSPGRYLWRIDDVKPLRYPIPCRGYQRFWTVPKDVEKLVNEQ